MDPYYKRGNPGLFGAFKGGTSAEKSQRESWPPQNKSCAEDIRMKAKFAMQRSTLDKTLHGSNSGKNESVRR